MIFYNILKNTWSNIASNVHTFLQLKTSLHPCPSPLVLRACACTPLLQSLPHHKLQYWHLLWFLLSADIPVFDSLQDGGRRECSSGDLPSWVGLIYSSLKQTMPALTPHNFSLLPGFWISFLVNSPWPLILSHGQNSTQDDLVQLPPPGTHHLTSCTQTTLPALSPRVEASTKSRPLCYLRWLADHWLETKGFSRCVWHQSFTLQKIPTKFSRWSYWTLEVRENFSATLHVRVVRYLEKYLSPKKALLLALQLLS